MTADVDYTHGSVTTALITGDYNTVMTGVNIILFGRFWNGHGRTHKTRAIGSNVICNYCTGGGCMRNFKSRFIGNTYFNFVFDDTIFEAVKVIKTFHRDL